MLQSSKMRREILETSTDVRGPIVPRDEQTLRPNLQHQLKKLSNCINHSFCFLRDLKQTSTCPLFFFFMTKLRSNIEIISFMGKNFWKGI